MEVQAKSPVERANARREGEPVLQAPSTSAFAGDRAAVTQRALAEAMHGSPRMAAQRALAETLHNSPRMAAQRKLFDAISRADAAVAQRVSAAEIPTLEESLRQRIFDYLSAQQPGSDESLRAEHAVASGNNAVSWLKQRPNFGTMPVADALEMGVAHFRETFARIYLSALALNAAENWVVENTGLAQGQFSIEDKKLTSGNCHGLTFARNREMLFNPDMTNLLDNWETIERPPIAVFLKGGKLAHTALKTDNGYLNTLPDGPGFYCAPALLAIAMGYDPIFLLPRDLAAVQRITIAAQAEQRARQLLDEADRILGYGSDYDVAGAKALHAAFIKLGPAEKPAFVTAHSADIERIMTVLTTDHGVEF